MSKPSRDLSALSARARQVLDTLYRLGEASASEILEETREDIPSYSAIRSIIRALEQKGYVAHFEKNLRYVYYPILPKAELSNTALSHILDTFFEGSPAFTMKALLDLSKKKGYDINWEAVEIMIEEAKKEDR